MTTHQRILILLIIAVFSAFIWKGGWAAWLQVLTLRKYCQQCSVI